MQALDEYSAADLPTHERVYRALRDTILDGALAPGEALTLRGIADRLSVSMTPAREAVRRLVAERALEMTASGRILIPSPGPERLEELFTARRLLEPELARRAVRDNNKGLHSQMAAINTAMNRDMEGGDPVGYIRNNTSFHRVLYQAAEAPALLALVESVWLQTAPMMRRVYGRLGTGDLADYHEAALDALAAGDAEALAAAIEADVAQGRDLLRQAHT
ncbi:MAG: GntR family transcriptional regulator [Pseudomonadota bacterium]